MAKKGSPSRAQALAVAVPFVNGRLGSVGVTVACQELGVDEQLLGRENAAAPVIAAVLDGSETVSWMKERSGSTGLLQLTVPCMITPPPRVSCPDGSIVICAVSGGGGGGFDTVTSPRRPGTAPSQCCSKLARKLC